MMIIFALYNIKGGVGKTAGAVNLAYLASQEGYKTLIVDLDPQASGTFYFRTEPGITVGKKLLLEGNKIITRSIKGTDYRNLDILPADFSFRNLDLVLTEMKKPKRRLGKSLKPIIRNYDITFLDCPPNITLVSENVFNVADIILAPVVPTTLAVRTYQQLKGFLEGKKNKAGKITPYFSMVERRKKLHLEIINEMRKNDTKFLETIIPYASDIEKMGVNREPVDCFAHSSQAAKAYRQLWKEIKKISKLTNPKKI